MSVFSWAILSALVWGIVPILEKLGLMGPTPPLTGVLWRSMGVLVGFLVLLALNPQELSQMTQTPPRSAFLLALAGVLASVVAQFTSYQALKKGEVSRVTPISGSYPFVTFILGLLLLGESWDWKKAAGVLLVVGGVILLRE